MSRARILADYVSSGDELAAVATTANAALPASTAASTYAPIADPIFTGTVQGVTKAHVGLSSVDNDSTSTIQAGTTAANVGLGSVTNESKTTMFTNPVFTGTGGITIPSGTTAQQPTAAAGLLRHNTNHTNFEYSDGTNWKAYERQYSFHDAGTTVDIRFIEPHTHHKERGQVSADGRKFKASTIGGYSGVSTNCNFEGDFQVISKWQHDYMGVGIAVKVDIRNSNFSGSSADQNGIYGGAASTSGFDSSLRDYSGQYHWPFASNGGITDDDIYYILHERSGNTITTDYSTDHASAQDPGHSTWSQVTTMAINSTDHCKLFWGEASTTNVIDLEITYVNVTGDYNFL